MSKIEGKAKKYDGTAIDYVSIFDWVDGKCIAQVVPDAAGNWQFNYFADLNIGITYVANGCEPITHGPYQITYSSAAVTTGMLLLVMSDVDYRPMFDKTATGEATWGDYFEQTKDIGLLEYNTTVVGGVVANAWSQRSIPQFDLNWAIECYAIGYLGTGASFVLTFEILDSQDVVIFALKAESKKTSPDTIVSYGANLEGLATSVVSDRLNGDMSFTASAVIYTRLSSDSSATPSFSFDVDLSNAASIRVGGQSSIAESGGRFTGGYFLVLPPS